MPKPTSSNPAPKYREVLALHIDRLYTDVELRTRPGLRNCPVGVVENDLIVCRNDAAERILPRDRRIIPLWWLRRSFPSLKTVDVSYISDNSEISNKSKACLNLIYVTDRSMYEAASAEVLQFIRQWIADKCAKFGCSTRQVPVEKKCKTYFFIDITALVDSMDDMDEQKIGGLSKRVPSRLLGHVQGTIDADRDPQLQKRLFVASYFAAELRRHVHLETKVTMSAGISCNMFLAKLATQLNKPDDQTTFFPDAAMEYLAKQPLDVLPRIGEHTKRLIAALCLVDSTPGVREPVTTVAHLLKFCPPDDPESIKKLPKLIRCNKKKLLDFSQGLDSTPVKNYDGDMPMSITCKQIVSGSTVSSLLGVLKTESRHLIELLVKDTKIFCRLPKTLSVSWEVEDTQTDIKTVCMPKKVRSLLLNEGKHSQEEAVSVIVQTVLKVLNDYDAIFPVRSIAVGAGSFVDTQARLRQTHMDEHFSRRGKKRGYTPSTTNTQAMESESRQGKKCRKDISGSPIPLVDAAVIDLDAAVIDLDAAVIDLDAAVGSVTPGTNRTQTQSNAAGDPHRQCNNNSTHPATVLTTETDASIDIWKRVLSFFREQSTG